MNFCRLGEIEGIIRRLVCGFSLFYEVLFTQRTLVECREGWFLGFWSFHDFMKVCSLKKLYRNVGFWVFGVFMIL